MQAGRHPTLQTGAVQLEPEVFHVFWLCGEYGAFQGLQGLGVVTGVKFRGIFLHLAGIREIEAGKQGQKRDLLGFCMPLDLELDCKPKPSPHPEPVEMLVWRHLAGLVCKIAVPCCWICRQTLGLVRQSCIRAGTCFVLKRRDYLLPKVVLCRVHGCEVLSKL